VLFRQILSSPKSFENYLSRSCSALAAKMLMILTPERAEIVKKTALVENIRLDWKCVADRTCTLCSALAFKSKFGIMFSLK
jgi:hypothetical protein